MESQIVHYSKILEINKDKVIYEDDNNQRCIIDLKECRKNWVQFANDSVDMGCKGLEEDETNCIGWRNAIGKPSFIELFSSPRVKIIFPYKQNLFEKIFKITSKKRYLDFYKVQKSINENGWSTFDLS